jgi:Mce-associated membrane protein
MLSYQPDTVEKDLAVARDQLTGAFRDSYTSLTRECRRPRSEKQAGVCGGHRPRRASVSATENHAEVLLIVNQTVNMGNNAPTKTASSVRVTLDKIGGRWLISGFDSV